MALKVKDNEGRDVSISFHHQHYPPQRQAMGSGVTYHMHRRLNGQEVPIVEETTCRILQGRGDEAVVLAEGHARVALGDPFYKEGARQLSLQRAVNTLDLVTQRGLRGALLSAYFNRRGHGER